MFSYKKVFVHNPKLAENKDVRIFSIHSVYYDKDGKPDGISSDAEDLNGFESFKDLQSNVKMLNDSFDKEILDLDNFPNEWKYEDT